MTDFQRVINREPAYGVAGDFASNNPRSSIVPPVNSGFVAAPAQSINLGYFAWGAGTGLVYSSLGGAGANPSLGLVGRPANEPADVITAYLADSSMLVNDGQSLTLFNSGDYWVTLPGATVGATVYADATTGAPTLTDNSGANPDTGFKCASAAPVNAVTNAATTIAVGTGIMTVAVVASGVITEGQFVTGTGVPFGVKILSQLSGGAGGAGTYQTDNYNRAAVAATTITMTAGTVAKISRVAA